MSGLQTVDDVPAGGTGPHEAAVRVAHRYAPPHPCFLAFQSYSNAHVTQARVARRVPRDRQQVVLGDETQLDQSEDRRPASSYARPVRVRPLRRACSLRECEPARQAKGGGARNGRCPQRFLRSVLRAITAFIAREHSMLSNLNDILSWCCRSVKIYATETTLATVGENGSGAAIMPTIGRRFPRTSTTRQIFQRCCMAANCAEPLRRASNRSP